MKQHLLQPLFLAVSLLTLWATGASAQYPDWQHSGSMFILTTPEGANLPAAATVKDFPLLVRLNKDFFEFGQAKADGADLRFSTKNGEPLAYQIEEWDAANGLASIWVKIPIITGNARQEIKIYWGNTAAVSESNGAAVFNSANNFAAVLHMNETVQDEVGTISAIDAGTALSTGVVGKSRTFSAGKGVNCGTEIKAFPSGSSPHSSEAWFKAKKINTTVLAWGVPTGQSKVVMNLASPSHLAVDCWFGGAGIVGDIPVPMSEWVHVVHAYDGKQAKLYVNGVIDNTAGSADMKIPNKVSMHIGGWNQVSGTYDFVGDIDEVRISKVARSADWIKLTYENQKPLQTLVGPIVQKGNQFSLSSTALTVLEGDTAMITAQAGGAQKIYWTLTVDGKESVVATDSLSYSFPAGRVSGETAAKLQFKAIYADGVKTKDIAITIKETVPEPVFTLMAPTKWDGRSTIEVVHQIKNLDAMQAANAGDIKFEWSAEPFAVTKEVSPGKLRLLRSQNSGTLTVTASVSNGGKPVTQSVDIMVTEPKSDAWIVRTPAKDEKPEDGQFYARDDKGLGTLYYNGTLNNDADAVFLKLYADDKLIKTEMAKPAADNSYSLSTQLKPGLIQYKVEFGTKTAGRETVLETVNDLVCGDAYVIDGQSNALATDTAEQSPPETNKWIRSYGRPSANKAGDKENLWCYPVWKAQKGEKAELGWWGMELAKRLVDSQKVPICIINAAAGGTRIDQHLPNPLNRRDTSGDNPWTNPHQLYGSLLTRVEGAKLTHGIRAILWHQGENDQGAAGPTGGYGWETYHELFKEMAASWKQDFPNVQNYYVFQIWPNSCGMGGRMGSGDMLREKQRTLPYLFSNMSIMSTLGISPPGGCHYPLEGWSEFARTIQPLIERDHYGKVPTGPISAANLKRAYFTTEKKDVIALEFDQPVVWSENLAGQFYLDDERDKVASGSVIGNVLTLTLKEASSAKLITYLKEIAWSQDNLLLGANGIAALTFCKVPIEK
ncbi:MAG: DUF2341 domain-containing protein [Pirellula sp.]|jgi:hypothetical protein